MAAKKKKIIAKTLKKAPKKSPKTKIKKVAKKAVAKSPVKKVKKVAVKPVAKKVAKPVAKKVFKPTPKKESKPIPKKEIKPAVKKEVKPIAKNEVKPVVKKEEKPVSANVVKPVINKELKPLIKKEPEFQKPPSQITVKTGKPGAKGKVLSRKVFEIEYPVKTSPKFLYNFLCTPSGLSEWFADDVNIKDDIFSFYWDGNEEKAQLLLKRENTLVRYRWLEDPEDFYFEFRILIDDLTGDVALVIIDFAEEKDMKAAMLLWDTQINVLLHNLGT